MAQCMCLCLCLCLHVNAAIAQCSQPVPRLLSTYQSDYQSMAAIIGIGIGRRRHRCGVGREAFRALSP